MIGIYTQPKKGVLSMKRLLSLLLVIAMVASYLPVTAGAEETVPVETGAEIIETTVPAQTEPVETTEE